MAKRIVSGIFILTALGALGVILAGAMTSGEQLIVRFLTAVTVAALALYVISDLRLQNEQEEAAAESDRRHGDRSAAQTTAAESVVTASHRRGRFGRRGRDASVQPAPNFEAIEPVTARTRPVSVADPTEAVTGSRLVPPAPEEAGRNLPPHPSTGHSTQERLDRPAPLARPSASIPPIPADDAYRIQVDTGFEHRLDDGADGSVDRVDEQAAADRVDAKPEFTTRPDERGPTSSNGAVIATTSFTYSGRLDSLGVEWPPRSPEADEEVARIEAGDAPASGGAVATPAASLPALTEVTAFGIDEDAPPPSFAPEPSDWLDAGRADSGSTIDLFAIDTADVFVTEPTGSEVSDAIESTDDAGRAPSTNEDPPVDENPPAADSAVAGPGPEEPAATRSSPVDPTPATPLIRRIEAAHYATPPRTDHLDLRDTDHLDLRDTEDLDLRDTDHLDLRDAGNPVAAGDPDRSVPVRPSASPSPDKLTAAIRSGELQVINSLINQGMLSTAGPITDRDVRTMVYVAFTSNELRKLILAGGTPDGIRAGDLDLGEVELFDESRFAPPPKLLYSGRSEASDTVLDLVALEEKEAAVTGSAALGLDLHPDDLDDTDLVQTLPTPRHLYRRSDVDRVEL